VIDISNLMMGKAPNDLAETLIKHDSLLPRLFGLSDASVCKTASVTHTVLNIAAPAWQHEFEFRCQDSMRKLIQVSGSEWLSLVIEISLVVVYWLGLVKMFIVPAWRSKCPRCWKFTVEENCPVCARCAQVLTSPVPSQS